MKRLLALIAIVGLAVCGFASADDKTLDMKVDTTPVGAGHTCAGTSACGSGRRARGACRGSCIGGRAGR